MECSEVKVKVTQNKTTPVKYRYLKNLLKYSNEVVLLRYWPPLDFDAVLLTACTSESWPGFLSLGPLHLSVSNNVQIQRRTCLVYKTFITEMTGTNKHTKLCCFPGKTNCIHCTHNSRFFGKLNKVIFPSQPKTHFFGDILLKQVLCSTAVDIDVSSSGIEENCPYKEFCLSWHLEGPWSKKTFPKSILHRNDLSYVQNVFNFFILTMFSKTIQLFNSLNNSEYMKWY